MFLGRDEGVFWAQDKNKMTRSSAFFNAPGRFYYLNCVQWAGIFHFIHHSRLAAVIPKSPTSPAAPAPKHRISSLCVLTMDVRAILRLHPKFVVGRYKKRSVPKDGGGYTVMTMAKSSLLSASPPCLLSHCCELDVPGRWAGPQLCLWSAHESLMVFGLHMKVSW